VGEVALLAVVPDAGDGHAVVEAELPVALADLGVGVAREPVGPRERAVAEAEVRLERRGRGERDVPHREHHRDDRLALGGRDRHGAVVRARLRVRRDPHLHPDRAALAAGDREREGVPLLPHDVVDGGDERVGPAARAAVQRRRARHVHEIDAVELHVVEPAGALERGHARGHVRRGAGHDDLEGLELVPRGGDARLRGGAGLRVGPDLLGGGRHPDVRRGSGEGGEGEHDEKGSGAA
jgi:hypothetical protein